jgi:cell wall-associated NlpC family hydrolase
MSQKSKFLVSFVTLLLLTFLSVQTAFAATNATLKKGMEGTAVTELQKDLKTLGFISVNPTGYFGDITKAAVIQFQKKYGLTADGIAGSKTLGKIDSLQGVNTTASRGTFERTGQSVVDFAKRLLGIKYRWGGTTTKGFDCSGFTKYVFSHFGITLNRTSTTQKSNGTYIKKADLLPGDLVLFDTNGGNNRINHVGIYVGSGKFIHASSSHTGVTISDITGGFYSSAYMTARRILS